MNKRIVSFTLNNCRAYHNNNNQFSFDNGENILIYGENGSGKSSIYKALNNFFQKSTDSNIEFVKNKYFLNENGKIEVTFANFNNDTRDIIPNTQETFLFSNSLSNNQIEFIQVASLVNGFLDYTDLLKVYLHEEEQPNLFDLIVLTLLGNYIPLQAGANYRLNSKWTSLQRDLTINAYTREDRCHRQAIRELPIFETHLRSTLNIVFEELNRLLSIYFSDFRIQLQYQLAPLTFNYEQFKSDWYTTSDLRLIIIKDGEELIGNYGDFLNEARLSAIAICLYLASLLKNPTNVTLKILYFDDVFIGLDNGNRLPILEILRHEFSSYQKIISTYDRHWFELAKRQFNTYQDSHWQTIELYAGTESIDDRIISKPIVVKGQSNYEKGIQYLHNSIQPDYPASANYFRKAVEEIITEFIPSYELIDINNVSIDDHKLTQRLKLTQRFLTRIDESTVEIDSIIGLLHNLIHPFSHHNITSPIYKSELLTLESSISNLRRMLFNLDINSNIKCKLERGKVIRLVFNVTNNKTYYYDIKLKETMILKNNNEEPPIMSVTKCRNSKQYGYENNNNLKPFTPSSTNPNFQYDSLQEAYTKIRLHLIQNGNNIPLEENFLTHFKYLNNDEWCDFDSLLIFN